MPTFTATDPDGKEVEFEWYEDHPPTEQDMEAIFATNNAGLTAPGTRLGGEQAGMRAATPGDAPSLWDRARDALKAVAFGDPEREEAQAAGIGLAPDAREMVVAPLGIGMGAANYALPALGIVNAPAAAGVVGQGVKAALPHMVKALGAQGLMAGGASAGAWLGNATGIPGAGVAGAFIGGMLGGKGAKIGRAQQAAKRAQQASKAAKTAGDVIDAEIVSSGPAARAAGPAVPVAPRALPPAGVAPGPKSVIIPLKTSDELIARILELREKHGQSPGQIIDALKQWHGIPFKDGSKAVKMVLGSK